LLSGGHTIFFGEAAAAHEVGGCTHAHTHP
jgi:hypothetical protein